MLEGAIKQADKLPPSKKMRVMQGFQKIPLFWSKAHLDLWHLYEIWATIEWRNPKVLQEAPFKQIDEALKPLDKPETMQAITFLHKDDTVAKIWLVKAASNVRHHPPTTPDALRWVEKLKFLVKYEEG